MFSSVEWLGPAGTDSGSLESQHKVASPGEEREDDGCYALAHPLPIFPSQSVVSIRDLLLIGALNDSPSPRADIGQCIESFLVLDSMRQKAL